MAIYKTRKRGGPIYKRSLGGDVISLVPERAVWELRLPGGRRIVRVVEKAVYVIDASGVRRKRLRLGVRVEKA